MTASRLSKDQWSRYWRRDSITTFSRRFNANYDLDFKTFWEERFAGLDDGARIVDLGTGNGAIPLLALQFSDARGKAFHVAGVDFAEIRPAAVLAAHSDLAPLLGRIEFLSRVPMESTGLASESVDLITSQYGLEYGDIPATLAEAWRVLKPGGTVAAILHHTGSLVIELAADAIRQVQYCLQKEELDQKIVALIRAMGESTTAFDRRQLKHNPKTEALRRKLNAALARINERAKRYRDPEGFIGVMLPNFMNVFAQHRDSAMEEKIRYVKAVRAEFDAFKARMADLKAAASSARAFDRIAATMERTGFTLTERGELHYGPNRDLMGWTLVARKAADCPVGAA